MKKLLYLIVMTIHIVFSKRPFVFKMTHEDPVHSNSSNFLKDPHNNYY